MYEKRETLRSVGDTLKCRIRSEPPVDRPKHLCAGALKGRHFFWNQIAPSLERISAKGQIRRKNLGNTLYVGSPNRDLHGQVAAVGHIG